MDCVKPILCAKRIKPVFLVSLIVFLGIYSYSIRCLANPKYTPFLISIAKESIKKQKLTKALRFLKRATFHDPSVSEAYYLEGLVYNQIGKPTEEINSYKKAIGQDLYDLKALSAAGIYYYDQGNFDSAVRYLTQAARSARKKQGKMPDIYFYLGLISEQRHFYLQAFNNYFVTLKVDRDYKNAYPKLRAMYNLVSDKKEINRRIDVLRFRNQNELADLVEKIIHENE